jgi:hypothetical protein
MVVKDQAQRKSLHFEGLDTSNQVWHMVTNTKVVQVASDDLAAAISKKRLDRQAKEEGSQRVALLHPLFRGECSVTQPKVRRWTIWREGKRQKVRADWGHGFQYTITTDGIEGVREI